MNEGLAVLISVIATWIFTMFIFLTDFSEDWRYSLKKFKTGFMRFAWPAIWRFFAVMSVFSAIYKSLLIFVVPA
ncbi:hypothetical protein [Serratia liquefaciens]|uniref:hypothetical protein n=1 Tax=Serratia liquefaciens TaxID=614 RepID=UPI002182F8D0|nr:hypothetical protein [Serratia liquefaciens]CAI2405801.1 Uncharacterised protein [Serratia liquefaciens]